VTQNKDEPPKNKISPQFAARLQHFGPKDKVRAIVLLDTGDVDVAPGRRQTDSERRATIEAMRCAAEQALDDIDGILAQFDGQRLAEHPDALGSVPVETTVAGITALASSERVRAILEDQSIHLTS
jgi:sorbitol-specific phosphotransferase system component IIA